MYKRQDVCNDGEEALDMIYAEMYDLIVLDLNLPGVDGMAVSYTHLVLLELPDNKSICYYPDFPHAYLLH